MSAHRTVRVVSWLGAALLAVPLALAAAPAGQIPGPLPAQAPASKLPAAMIAKQRYEATTEKKSLKQGTVSAGGMTWNCAGSRCTASQPAGTAANACRALAREVGAIASFVFGTKTFSAAELAQCRTAVATTMQKKSQPAARTAVAAQIDPEKAKQLQTPTSPPGGLQPQIKPGVIAVEPADLRVASMSLLANRKVAIAVHANASANGRNATVELYDAQSNRKLWNGGITIVPMFGKHGAIAVADYQIPAQRRQKLKARVTPLDDNPANNELSATLGPAGAPVYVHDGVVRAQAPNRIEKLTVARKGPDWMELLVTTVVATEYGELHVEPMGVRNALCTPGSGAASSASENTLLVRQGYNTLRLLCRAEPQTASGSVRVRLAIHGRVVSTQTTPWNVTPASAGDSGPPARADLVMVRGRMEFIDEKPGRLWVRFRNNGPERVYQLFSVGWFAYGGPPGGQLVAQGKTRQAFNLASGEEKEVSFDLRAHRSVRGLPLTWTRDTTGYRTNIGVIVDSDGDVFESNEDNNRSFVPVTHPTFGNFRIGEGTGG
ncbi:MAG TPA: hypothetical protein VF203_05305 [Burkholderiales bacterium]